MPKKRKTQTEFRSYAERLEQIKKDIEEISVLAETQAPTENQINQAVFRLKRVLEHIVYGILEIQIPVIGNKIATRRWQKSKAIELIKKVEPNFYPQPLPTRRGPYVKVTNKIRNSEALTREQWLTAWDFVNQIQHVQNPTSEKSKLGPLRIQNDILKWTQRVINLLSYHTTISTNDSLFVEVAMEWGKNAEVRVRVVERTEPWLTTLKLPDVGSMKMQRKDKDGQWHEITDPEEGSMTIMRVHGVYTKHGLLRSSE